MACNFVTKRGSANFCPLAPVYHKLHANLRHPSAYLKSAKKVRLSLSMPQRLGGAQICCIPAVDGGKWPVSGPGLFTTRRKTLHLLYRRMCGLQGLSGRFGQRKIFVRANSRTSDHPAPQCHRFVLWLF